MAIVAACESPLVIDTPRRLTRVNLDSLITTESFIGGSNDSIFAYIDNHEVVFATEVARPVFYNRMIDGKYYVTVQATRYGLNGRDYEVMSLRLDGIRDTGTYEVNAAFSVPKQIDINAPPSYGALYERRVNGGFPESYRTGHVFSGGTIRVIRIDEERGVMVGTFEFRGYYIEHDSVVTIDRGAFRLYLKK
jgi:hypothetical protein